MIFVTVGTDIHSFSRLIDYVEKLKQMKIIKEKIIIQYGYTKIKRKIKGITYIDFIPLKKFNYYLKNANFIISHGGLGNLLQAIKFRKKVIAVPRLKKFNEHKNDHQLELVKQLAKEKKILFANDLGSLIKCIKKIKNFEPGLHKKMINPLKIIETFIKSIEK
ncbi:MAG: glycosyltransferase [Candidatus Pacearchaeota archaeon]